MEQVENLIFEIIKYLKSHSTVTEVDKITSLLEQIPLNKRNQNYLSSKPPKDLALNDALNSIKMPMLNCLRTSILNAADYLCWKVDQGEFYSEPTHIGQDYWNGNMNAELIGPEYGFYKSKELRLGLFLLEKHIFYRDHKHATPEVYLNLTPGSNWRFEDLSWKKKQPGSIIYNGPNRTHAIKIGSVPFLSIWCWPKGLDEQCTLVKR